MAHPDLLPNLRVSGRIGSERRCPLLQLFGHGEDQLSNRIREDLQEGKSSQQIQSKFLTYCISLSDQEMNIVLILTLFVLVWIDNEGG